MMYGLLHIPLHLPFARCCLLLLQLLQLALQHSDHRVARVLLQLLLLWLLLQVHRALLRQARPLLLQLPEKFLTRI